MVVVLCCLGFFCVFFYFCFFWTSSLGDLWLAGGRNKKIITHFQKKKSHFCANTANTSVLTSGGRICKHTPLLTFNTIWQREARALESPLPLVKTLKYAGNAKVCKKFALCIFTAHYWEKTNKKTQLNLSLQWSYSLPFVRHLPCCWRYRSWTCYLPVSSTETDLNCSETNIGSFGFTCGQWQNEENKNINNISFFFKFIFKKRVLLFFSSWWFSVGYKYQSKLANKLISNIFPPISDSKIFPGWSAQGWWRHWQTIDRLKSRMLLFVLT